MNPEERVVTWLISLGVLESPKKTICDPEEFLKSSLKNGVVLCKLINRLLPGSVEKVRSLLQCLWDCLLPRSSNNIILEIFFPLPGHGNPLLQYLSKSQAFFLTVPVLWKGQKMICYTSGVGPQMLPYWKPVTPPAVRDGRTRLSYTSSLCCGDEC